MRLSHREIRKGTYKVQAQGDAAEFSTARPHMAGKTNTNTDSGS